MQHLQAFGKGLKKIFNNFYEKPCCFLDFYNFVPLKQFKTITTMKKVFFAVVTASVVALASCGGNAEDKAKAAADSARIADSIAAVKADSAAKAAEAAAAADTTKKDTAA